MKQFLFVWQSLGFTIHESHGLLYIPFKQTRELKRAFRISRFLFAYRYPILFRFLGLIHGIFHEISRYNGVIPKIEITKQTQTTHHTHDS